MASSIRSVSLLLLLTLLSLSAGYHTVAGEKKTPTPYFVPKFTHIPEIDAYYRFLNQNAETILRKVPDFFDPIDVPTGWASTQLCSAIFVSGIEEERAIVEDVSSVSNIVELEVDYDEQSVMAYLIGDSGTFSKAIYREGVGCTLVDGISEDELRRQDLGDHSPLPPPNATVPWPLGDYVDGEIPDGVDMQCIEDISDADFAHRWHNTRAFLIVYKDKIIYERYADGITQNSKLIGWSMTKSVTGSFIGMLTGEGLDIDDPAPVPEWEGVLDPRGNITVRDMLHMGSGIGYMEFLVTMCLFSSDGDCASWYADRRLRDEPGTTFEYSTASTTLLARIGTEQRSDRDVHTNFEYWRTNLYTKIQMHNSIVETQPTDGVPHGGSNMFASARDWARFGHLYLNGGVWDDGTRVLPEGWADFTCTSGTTYGGYGALWWIADYGGYKVCRMDGFRAQNVFNVAEKDLTVVRLAMPGLITQVIDWDQADFMTDILGCFD